MTELRDLVLPGVSNCCGAKVYEPDWCADCKDHCGVEPEHVHKFLPCDEWSKTCICGETEPA